MRRPLAVVVRRSVFKFQLSISFGPRVCQSGYGRGCAEKVIVIP